MRELTKTRDPMGRLEPNRNDPVMNALGYSTWQTWRNLIYRITPSWNNDKRKCFSGGPGLLGCEHVVREGQGVLWAMFPKKVQAFPASPDHRAPTRESPLFPLNVSTIVKAGFVSPTMAVCLLNKSHCARNLVKANAMPKICSFYVHPFFHIRQLISRNLKI